jgi:hypothetical protein
MSIEFYYKGKINLSSIEPLCTEVSDICQTLSWQFHRWTKHKCTDAESTLGDVFGISFRPPNCETIFLTFNKAGILQSPLQTNLNNVAAHHQAFLSARTFYAGIHAHCNVIKLLKYIGKTYMTDFELMDTTGYAHHEDFQELYRTFDRHDTAFDIMCCHMDNCEKMDESELHRLQLQLQQMLSVR